MEAKTVDAERYPYCKKKKTTQQDRNTPKQFYPPHMKSEKSQSFKMYTEATQNLLYIGIHSKDLCARKDKKDNNTSVKPK